MVLSADRKTAECKLCKLRMLYWQQSTSNLIRHVKTKHPVELRAEMQQQGIRMLAPTSTSTPSLSPGLSAVSLTHTSNSSLGPATPSTASSTTAAKSGGGSAQTLSLVSLPAKITASKYQIYNPDSRTDKHMKLDELVVDFIVADMQPLSIVQGHAFNRLVSALDPGYKLMSKERLEDELLVNRYTQERDRLVEELKLVKQVCLSVDQWTSHTGQFYLTITAHYIVVTALWEWKSHVLKTLAIAAEDIKQTRHDLASELHMVVKEFGLEGKISTVVTDVDHFRNLTKAVEIIKAKHQLCFAQGLNLVLQEAIEGVEEISSLVRKVRDIVTYFHSSSRATNSLRELSETSGQKKLNPDVEAGWVSTYNMLRTYLDQQESVTTVLSLTGLSHMCLDLTNKLTLQMAMDVLEPFYEAIVELSSERNTSASKIIPMVKILSKFTGRCASPLSQRLNDMLHKRFVEIEESTHLALATLLDPRFKTSGFSTPEAATKAVQTVGEELRRDELSRTMDSVKEEPASPQISKPSLLWSAFDQEVSSSQQIIIDNPLRPTVAEIEVKRYLDCPALARDQDPLLWWRENGPMLPRLALMARGVLAAPATVVPGERILSAAGDLFSYRRSSLTDNNVDLFLFLNKS